MELILAELNYVKQNENKFLVYILRKLEGGPHLNETWCLVPKQVNLQNYEKGCVMFSDSFFPSQLQLLQFQLVNLNVNQLEVLKDHEK